MNIFIYRAKEQKVENHLKVIIFNAGFPSFIGQHPCSPLPERTSGAAVIGTLSMPFSEASIRISDGGGKVLSQFVLPQQHGAGSVTFDGGSVAAGSYSYTLLIDGKAYDTKTMVILKD
jgi:hypothetical protein